MHDCLFTCHSDLPELAGTSNLWWRNYLYNVTQLIKCLIRSAWPLHMLPVMITIDTSYYSHIFCHFTWVLGSVGTIIPYQLPHTSHEPWLCLAPQYTSRYRGRGQCLRALYFREFSNFSSVLGSFCPDTCHIRSMFSYKLYSAACICLTNINKFGNGLHIIPGFSTPYSIVDVRLRHM